MVSTGIGMSQPSNTAPVPTGTTGAMQTSLRRDTEVGGTQTSPPPQPKKHTASGGTQTAPPQDPHQDEETQDQLDHNQVTDDD